MEMLNRMHRLEGLPVPEPDHLPDRQFEFVFVCWQLTCSSGTRQNVRWT